MKKISKTKLQEAIKNGANLVHLISFKNILRPRGSMQKNSLGEYILEKLENSYESWTDPKYIDNPDFFEVMTQLNKNLYEEVNAAYDQFLYNVMKCENHPKYYGIRKPHKTEKFPNGCPKCWRYYKLRHTISQSPRPQGQ